MSSIINIAANRIKQRFTSQLSVTRPGSEMSINSTGSLRDSMRTEVSHSSGMTEIKLIGNKYGSIARTNAGTSPKNPNWISEIKKQVDDEIFDLFRTSTKSSVQADVKRVLNIKIQ